MGGRMSSQNESRQEIEARAERSLRIARVLLMVGFVSAAFLVWAGVHPLASLGALFAGGAGAVKMARRAQGLWRESERKKEMEEAAMATAESDSAVMEFRGEARDLKELAGIELFNPSGFLGGRPVYLFAIKEATVYEYEGVAPEDGVTDTGLVINNLLYMPALESRAQQVLIENGKRPSV